jgi:hypothetical protein
MRQLAEIGESVAGTTKKNEKVRIVAEFFRSQSADEAAIAAIFLSGRTFPAYEEITLQVGGTMLWQVLRDISRLSAIRRPGLCGLRRLAIHGSQTEHADIGTSRA